MVPLAAALRAERARCSSAVSHLIRSAAIQQNLSARVAIEAAGLQQRCAAGRIGACRAQRLHVISGGLGDNDALAVRHARAAAAPPALRRSFFLSL